MSDDYGEGDGGGELLVDDDDDAVVVPIPSLHVPPSHATLPWVEK